MFKEKNIKLLESLDGIPFYLEIAEKIGHKSAFLFGHILNLQKNNIPIISLDQLKIIKELSYNRGLNNALSRLIKVGLITKHQLTPEEKMEILLLKRDYNNYGIGSNECEWCGCKTMVLHQHHYPIPKKNKGTETVNICPNCHYEYHSLTYILRLSDEIFSQLKQAE